MMRNSLMIVLLFYCCLFIVFFLLKKTNVLNGVKTIYRCRKENYSLSLLIYNLFVQGKNKRSCQKSAFCVVFLCIFEQSSKLANK